MKPLFLFLLLFPFCSMAQINHSMHSETGNGVVAHKATSYNYPLQPGPTKTAIPYMEKKVAYDLFVTDTMVNFTGRHRHAIAINGQIPASILEFTENDTAIIRVHTS